MNIHPLLALSLSVLLASAVHAVAAPDQITVIDDAELIRDFERKVGALAEAGEGITADELSASLSGVPKKCDVTFERATESNGSADDSVYVIGSVFLCGKCDKWHRSGHATAWALSSDGLMVTNYHVFENAKGGAMAVCGNDGTVHRVTEILAADQANDLAVFRVNADSLQPLALAAPAPVGTAVEVVSHPEGSFFAHSFGHISRYNKAPQKNDAPSTVQMAITADFAIGSSGAPVLNAAREVVGVVCSTRTIHARNADKSTPGSAQMVVKICAPVAALTAMLPETQKNAERTLELQ